MQSWKARNTSGVGENLVVSNNIISIQTVSNLPTFISGEEVEAKKRRIGDMSELQIAREKDRKRDRNSKRPLFEKRQISIEDKGAEKYAEPKIENWIYSMIIFNMDWRTDVVCMFYIIQTTSKHMLFVWITFSNTHTHTHMPTNIMSLYEYMDAMR